jgi:hypothetical protein
MWWCFVFLRESEHFIFQNEFFTNVKGASRYKKNTRIFIGGCFSQVVKGVWAKKDVDI